MTIPLSSGWGVWTGKEIEGEDQLGVSTLFIRSLRGRTMDSILTMAETYKKGPFRRVWICKEYISSDLSCNVLNLIGMIKHIRSRWTTCVIAVEVSSAAEYHGVFSAREMLLANGEIEEEDVVIYVKINWISPTKPCDYVCVGKAYADKAVKIQGNEVSPEQYANDVCLDHWSPLPN